MFRSYLAEEVLENDNAFRCSKCSMKVKAIKTLSITRPPENLIVNIKRHRFHPTQGITKAMTLVDFPEELKLRVRVSKDEKQHQDQQEQAGQQQDHRFERYVLYAAIIHSGSSFQFGHYYIVGRSSDAAIKSIQNQPSQPSKTRHRCLSATWHFFNDASVSTASLEELRNLSVHFPSDVPYALFYARVPSQPPRPLTTENHHSAPQTTTTTTSTTLTTSTTSTTGSKQQQQQQATIPDWIRHMVKRDNDKYAVERKRSAFGGGSGGRGYGGPSSGSGFAIGSGGLQRVTKGYSEAKTLDGTEYVDPDME